MIINLLQSQLFYFNLTMVRKQNSFGRHCALNFEYDLFTGYANAVWFSLTVLDSYSKLLSQAILKIRSDKKIHSTAKCADNYIISKLCVLRAYEVWNVIPVISNWVLSGNLTCPIDLVMFDFSFTSDFQWSLSSQ